MRPNDITPLKFVQLKLLVTILLMLKAQYWWSLVIPGFFVMLRLKENVPRWLKGQGKVG